MDRKFGKLYCLGGGTCCGKSSVAKILCEKYSLTYFKQDDFLMDAISCLAGQDNPLARYVESLSTDETWLRTPEEQFREEAALYAEMVPYMERKIAELPRPVLAEGAGFLPGWMRDHAVEHYVCMVPTAEFRRKEYPKRTWISQVLRDCSQPDIAFDNWMRRDELFSEMVADQAAQLGYPVVVVDGLTDLADIVTRIEQIFALSGERASE